MADLLGLPSAATEPQPKPPSRLRRVGVIAAGAAILLAAYFLHTSTKPLALSDGRRFDLLQYSRNTLALYDPKTGQWDTEQRLLVKYYSNSRDRDSMLLEARRLAPALFPIADSLGLRVLFLETSKPLFLRSYPLLITTWNVRFVHDSSGVWKEQR